MAKASQLWHVIAVYATLFSVAQTLLGTLVSQTLVTRWFSDQRGMAIGISAMGTNVGAIVFPILIAYWLPGFGWRETLVWVGGLSIVLVAPATWLVLRRPPPPVPAIPASAATPEMSSAREWTTQEILSSRAFWLPTLSFLPIIIAVSSLLPNIGVISNDVGLTTQDAANLIAFNSVCMISGKVFFGVVADRSDHRFMFWIVAGFMSAAFIVLQNEPSVVRLVIGVGLVGLSGGGVLPMFGVMYSSRFGVASFGRVMGLVLLAITLGAIGPVVAGWSYDATGSYDPAFRIFLALIIAASIAMVRLPAPPVQESIAEEETGITQASESAPRL